MKQTQAIPETFLGVGYAQTERGSCWWPGADAGSNGTCGRPRRAGPHPESPEPCPLETHAGRMALAFSEVPRMSPNSQPAHYLLPSLQLQLSGTGGNLRSNGDEPAKPGCPT